MSFLQLGMKQLWELRNVSTEGINEVRLRIADLSNDIVLSSGMSFR